MTRKKSKVWLVVAIVVAAVIVGLVVFKNINKGNTSVDVYQVSALDSGYMGDSTSMDGTVTEGTTQTVSLKDALVDEVCVEEGQEVKVGDVLLKYDVESFQLTIKSDEAKITALESDIEKANTELDKLKTLIPSEYAPSYDYDDSGSDSETVIHHEAETVKTFSTIEAGASPSEKGETRVYYCTKDTVVKASFLEELYKNNAKAEFQIYENNVLQGSFTVDGSKLGDSPWAQKETTTDSADLTSSSAAASAVTLSCVSKSAATGQLTSLVKEPETTDTEVPTTEPTETPTETPTPEPTAEPTTEPTPEPTAEPTPEPTAEPTTEPTPEPTAEPTTEPTPSTPTPEPTTTPTPEETVTFEDWTIGDGVEFNGDGTASLDLTVAHYGVFSSVVPGESSWDEYVYNDSGDSGYSEDYTEDTSENYMYTRAELDQKIQEQTQQIKELQLDLKEAKITYKKDKLTAETGEVTAEISGTVQDLTDPASLEAGGTVMTIAGKDKVVISISVNEMNLDQIAVGDTVNVTGYETGSVTTAVITEIKTEPVEDVYYYGNGNPNSSYYPVLAVVDDDSVDMRTGESCGVTLEDDTSSDNIFLPVMYIRSDNGGDYVYVQNSEGRIEKRYIKTGMVMWGYAKEITSGLTRDEYIAFPYGKNVIEGAAAVEAEATY